MTELYNELHQEVVVDEILSARSSPVPMMATDNEEVVESYCPLTPKSSFPPAPAVSAAVPPPMPSSSSSPHYSNTECPFSVEVEATGGAASQDGALKLSAKCGWTLALGRRSSITTKVESWEDNKQTSETDRSSGDDESPAGLVPVGSSSESDDSLSQQTQEEGQDQDEVDEVIEEEDGQEGSAATTATKPTAAASSSLAAQELVVAESTTLEMVKHNTVGGHTEPSSKNMPNNCEDAISNSLYQFCCLADHISSVLCPIDLKATAAATNDSGSIQSRSVQQQDYESATPSPSCCHPQTVTASCAPELPPLYEYDDDDEDGEGDELNGSFFGSLNFWGTTLSPSQEEARRKRSSLMLLEHHGDGVPRRCNRSHLRRKRRNRYIERLYDMWHHAPPTPAPDGETLRGQPQRQQRRWSIASGTSSLLRTHPPPSHPLHPQQQLQQQQDSYPLARQCKSFSQVSQHLTVMKIKTKKASKRGNASKAKSTVNSRVDDDNDLHYDSDPEQEPWARRQRRISLLSPTSAHRRDSTSLQQQDRSQSTSSSSIGSFRDRRPSVIETHHHHYHHRDNAHGDHGEETSETETEGTTATGGGPYTDDDDHSMTSTTADDRENDDGDAVVPTDNDDGSITPHPPPPPEPVAPVAPRNVDRIDFDFNEVAGTQGVGEETEQTVQDVNGVDGTDRTDSTGLSQSSLRDINAATNAAGTDVEYECTDSSTTSASTSSSVGPEHAKTHTSDANAHCTSASDPSTDWTESSLLNKYMNCSTKEYAQELSNLRFALVWHPPATPVTVSPSSTPTSSPMRPNAGKQNCLHKKSKTIPPMAVQGAFEVGAHLETTVIQPKFTWCPILQPSMHDRRKLVLSESAPNSVELLSIIRVNKPVTLDRDQYPFCRIDRAICITTNDLNHPFVVWEASSPSERDRLVVALKLIVARLASIIIVRNEEMLLEFFSPYSALLQLEDEDDNDEDAVNVDDHGSHDINGRRRRTDASPMATQENEKTEASIGGDYFTDSIERDTSNQEQHSDDGDLREELDASEVQPPHVVKAH